MYKVSKPLLQKQRRLTELEKGELSKQIKSYKSQSDAVLYAFALLPGDKFPADEKKIHTAFYKLKEAYPEFFDSYSFDTNGTCPYSEKLEQSFFFFMQSGCISIIGPWFANYYMDQKMKDVVLKHLDDKFSPEEKTKLKDISVKLQDLLNK